MKHDINDDLNYETSHELNPLDLQLKRQVLLVLAEALLIFERVISYVGLTQFMYLFEHIVALILLLKNLQLELLFLIATVPDPVQLL